MPATTYNYALSATLNNKLSASSLDSQIRNSAITIALEGVTLSGASINIEFKDALPTTPTDQKVTILDGLVAAHDGEPLPEAAAPLTSDGKPRIQVDSPEGVTWNGFSPDWCKKETWWPDSEQVVGETPADQGGGVYDLANAWVIDATHAKLSQEHRLRPQYAIKVYEDGVLKTEREFAYDAAVVASDGRTMVAGDYEVDYAIGQITFFTPPSGAITVDYWYATSSAMYLTPAAGKVMALDSSEVQGDVAVVMKDTVIFQVQVVAAALAAAGGMDPNDLMSNGGSILDSDYVDHPDPELRSEFPNIQSLHDEAQRAYTHLQQVGGDPALEPRAMECEQFIARWPWSERAKKPLSSAEYTRIKIFLQYDQPFGGKKAILTTYAKIEDVPSS